MRYWPLLLLAGCASSPVSEYPIPARDMALCEAIANSYNMAEKPAARGAVGAATGAAADAALGGAAFKIMGYTAPLHMGSLVVPLLAYGMGNGIIEAREEKTRILRECLRDKGHKVY